MTDTIRVVFEGIAIAAGTFGTLLSVADEWSVGRVLSYALTILFGALSLIV